MNRLKHIIILLLMISLSAHQAYAQFKPETEMTPDEKDLFEQSLEDFDEKNFNKSLEGFSQLLSLYPREPVFNFVYGASMVQLHNDIKKGIDYLEFAAGKGVGEANFYIGLGYHFLYDFNNAIHFYETFKNSVKEKYWDDYEIEKHIGQSTNGKDLLNYAYDLHVISNKQISSKNFYYSYDLKNFGGEIIVKTEQFKGKADKKIDKTDLMYISDRNNVVLLSSYGDSRKNSLDLYISQKTTEGWSEPLKLPDIINTPYDEAFPFLTEDGSTLYFSSKGHNSIGGYDIFKSSYNSKNKTWSQPKNLDFPINTPFDEVMFASDRYNETAYFASSRTSNSERIGVYRILLDREPLLRHLTSMDEINQHASLEINPGAMAELTKRQDIRANSMIDTSLVRDETFAQNDTANSIKDLINESFVLLYTKSSSADEFLEYAASAYQICELNIEEIERLNKKIKSLKNKNDSESAYIKDSLNKLLTEKAMIATEMYDLSQYFYTNGTQIKSLTSYYDNELGLLDDISENEIALEEKTEKLYNEIQNINTSDPMARYSIELLDEINAKQKKLNNYQSNLDDELVELSNLNNKIKVKLDLAKNEKDINVREKYVYDIKTYENKKIDIISSIKEIEVQIEFLNYEIKQIKLRDNLVKSNKYNLEESLYTNPELDLSKLNNEVELLKTHVSQNSLRELSYKQDEILADKQYYSSVIDFDAILYVEPDISNIGLDEIMIDTKSYTDKYKDILSDNALKTGDLVFENDSLKDQITYLETEFDNAESSVEKQQIITEINRITSEISENNAQIAEYLGSQPRVNVDIYITEFENLKDSQAIDLSNPEVKETENLIIESLNLLNDISDLKLLGTNDEIPPMLYLEGMKSEIDNLIVAKIEIIKASIIIVENTNTQVDIFENLENELRNVRPSENFDMLQELTSNFDDINKIYRNAEKEKDTIKKNELLTEANRKLDLSVENNITFLNDQLVREYELLRVYDNNFIKIEEQPEFTNDYINKISALQTEAADLQMQAEETQDELERMQNLSQAWNNLRLANEYYDYVFEITQDGSKYKDDYEIKTNRTTNEFIAANNEIIRIEPIVNNNTDVIANNDNIEINNNTENDTENNTENDNSHLSLNETINKLNDVNYQGKLIVNISSQTKEKTDIENLADKIKTLKDDIASTNNDDKKENLKTDLRRNEEQQIDAIIKYSITTNEILAELDTISKINNNYDEQLIRNLRNKQAALRNSIIDYSNFYAADEIMEKHLSATEIESELLDLYNSMIQSTDEHILAEGLTKVENNTDTNIIVDNTDNTEPEFSSLDNYSFEYPYDKNTESQLVSLETEISTIEVDIKEHESIIAGLESSMSFMNDLKEYKKLQKQLEKENKKYLKSLKSWAGLNKELIALKYDFGDTHYFNVQSVNSDVTNVSDSIKSISDDKLDESLALIAVIITYNAKYADNSIVETYKKAVSLSADGVNSLNTANNLKSSGDITDPIVLAHYRSTETTDEYISDTSTNELMDSSLVLSNDITNDTLPIIDTSLVTSNDITNDTLPIIDTTTLAEYTDINNNTEANNNNNETNNNIETETSVVVNNDLGNLFDLNSNSFYSDANPINGIPNTEGLFYRIQIAAFNGKVANDRFIGMKPIFWEAIPNSALVRYIVGNFLKLDNARTNLPTVQAMGYADAFIVAYYNGERIPIYEARRIEERDAQTQDENNVIAVNNTTEDNNINVANNTELNENTTTNENDTELNTNTLETDDITQTSGVFFCVQIGVYTTELGPDRLYGLNPLMYHNYTGKLVRHTFGKYYDFNTAVNEQNKIRRLGIPDAFIVAYYNGEKITINEARDLLANTEQTGDEILVNIPDNQIPANVPVIDNNNVAENNQPEDNNTDVPTQAPIIEYYIQIGVFRNDVNTHIRSSFRRIAGDNQLVRLTNNNITLYRIGVFSTFQDAQNSLGGVIGSGIKDAFVVAFVNGKRVNINQARSIE